MGQQTDLLENNSSYMRVQKITGASKKCLPESEGAEYDIRTGWNVKSDSGCDNKLTQTLIAH